MLLHLDLVLGENCLELVEIEADDVIEDAIHRLLQVIQAPLRAGLRQVHELRDTLEVEQLADPEVLVDEGALFCLAFESDELLAL